MLGIIKSIENKQIFLKDAIFVENVVSNMASAEHHLNDNNLFNFKNDVGFNYTLYTYNTLFLILKYNA